ncbi:MAG: hypothetical protein Q9213_002229 [Squamulea squamosa]
MAELQPESAPAIQHFLQWKLRPGIRKIGCGGPDNTLGSNYISHAVLQDYLTVDRIKTLLEALFEDPSQSPLNADRVRAKYLRPFAILLSSGCGRMIRHFLNHQALQDTFLPFRSEPEDFPKSAVKNLFGPFRKEQWQFYPFPLDYDMSDDLANDYILPITAKEEIGDGGSAILYKIVVDEAYNALKPVDPVRAATKNLAANTFALKTYRTPEAQKYFENERDAFIRLRHGGRPHANIIEFYGSFVRDGTYNIILEYADRGTLDDYMKHTPEPKSIPEITTFWRSFFPVMYGLAHIHGTPGTASDGPNILLGWHHDIDPSNILVVSKSQGSLYDCNFKIADLGLAHFKRYISSSGNATDDDRYGMNPYGAPETYRDKDLETCHLQVLQSADIWSTGCVLSEVATWITEGIEKLLEYRRRRREEIVKRSKGSITDEERFHHVSEVLDAVKGIHTEIRDNSRKNDLITPWVIERLVNGMVRPDPYHRATARVFLETSKEILSEADWQLKQAMLNGPAPHAGHTIWDMTVDVRKRRAPPSSPPDQVIASSRAIDNNPEQATVLRRPSAHNAQSGFYHFQQGFAAELNGEKFRQRDQGAYGDSPFDDLETSREQSSTSHTPPRVLTQPTPSRVQNQHDPQSIRPGPASVPYRRWENKVMHARGGPSSAFQDPTELQTYSEHSDSDKLTERQLTAAHELPLASNLAPKSPPPKSPPPKSPSSTVSNPAEMKYPRMSVTEGLRVRREKQWKFVKYPGQNMFYESDEILKKRDHVFLVDNGESMRPYRPKVEAVSELLSTLTQPYDPDGLDLYFTTESSKLRPKTPEKFLQYLRERSAYGCPDFRQRFAKIVENYQSQFGRTNYRKKLLHPNSTPSKGPRPLSLYVLTDAVWDPGCTLITEVKNLVALLQEHRLPNKYVGIQFIRFGNDPEGKKRLKTLDSELGLGLDVVDTTSADGNVWKMLLGAVNDWYDNDVDSDDDDNKDAIQPQQ